MTTDPTVKSDAHRSGKVAAEVVVGGPLARSEAVPHEAGQPKIINQLVHPVAGRGRDHPPRGPISR